MLAAAAAARRAPCLASRCAAPTRSLSGSGSGLGGAVRRSYDNGNLLFGVAAASATAGAWMYWQERRADDNREDLRYLAAGVRRHEEVMTEERRKRHASFKPSDDPTLFRAKVTRRVAPHMFDGPLALKDVAVGDLVDVTKTEAGPRGHEKGYHKCRTGVSEGLYPTHSLERLPDDEQ